MEKTNLSKSVILGCMILVITGWAFTQDWPQWRGPNRDGKVSGFTAPQKWPEELTQKWKTTVGLGDSTPALLGNRIYVFARQGEEEVTLCLDAGSGKELWNDKYKAQAVTGPPSRHPGPRSSPAVANGKVVTIGVGGVLSCLDAATGKLVWRKDPFPKIVPQFFTAMSPIIVDGMVIAHLGGQGNGAVISYDLTTGDQKWQWAGEGPEYASPALLTVEGTKQIVTLAEKSVVGIGLADGKLLWQLPFTPQRRAYNAATPIIEGQTVIYTGAGRGIKAVKIEKQADGFVAKELWSNPEVAPQFNTPVLKDGLLFGLSNRGNLFCVNSRTGQTAWIDPTQRDRGGFTSIVDTGSVVIALPSNSELIAFKPNDKEFTELARIKVSDTPIYAHPVIAGNRIFIKDQETVTMWTID
ncbi:MAG: PQQ-binding-like beta-propeller repeat protein [Candidatus Aminicenantes bacterium]|nr:PQQ-binding-like beta-propeller repeat protein [Candidatus Aminicenantes bacterium]